MVLKRSYRKDNGPDVSHTSNLGFKYPGGIL
jgi:hypothetical protein